MHATFTIRTAGGERRSIEASAFPIVASEAGSSGAMILFWPLERERRRVKLKVWGARGLGAGPGAAT